MMYTYIDCGYIKLTLNPSSLDSVFSSHFQYYLRLHLFGSMEKSWSVC